MNKPILVNNNEEWSRLAPVLDKHGYNWNHPFFKLPEPSVGMMQIFNEGRGVVIYLNKSIQWNPLALHDSRPTQTVDEYIALQEPKKLPPLIQHLADAIDAKAYHCTFGLTPNNIAVIERVLADVMIDRSEKWTTIGREIGWEEHTACEWYIRKLQSKLEAQTRAIGEALEEMGA